MKNCIAFLDEGPNSGGRLEFALGFAERLDAHLTACALTLEVPFHFAGGSMASAEIWRQKLDSARARIEALANQVDQRLARSQISTDLRSVSLPLAAVSGAAARFARYADVSILGLAEKDPAAALQREVLSGALFESGRPVLVTTPQADPEKALRRVLIAWDGGPQAARAVADAGPLLERADDVHVVVVDPQVSPEDHGELPGGDIALTLSRRGVRVEVHQLPLAGRTVAQTIVAHARDWDAGMVVMGGFGHSPFREYLFGGVTRELLDDAAAPLFMAH